MASSVQVDVRSLRSAQLQIELKKRGLSSSGKKSELRRRLEEALAKEKGESTATAAAATVTASATINSTTTTTTTTINSTTATTTINSATIAVTNTAFTSTTAVTATSANSNEDVVSDKHTAEQLTASKVVTMATRDNTVTNMTASEEKSDKVDDSKGKDIVISTTQEPTAPIMATHTQEDKVAEPIKPSQDSVADKEVTEKPSEGTRIRTQHPEPVKSAAGAGSGEVSMETDELVVHTVDEDDFKIEEQSRDHVGKKSGELPSSTTDEQGEVDSPSVKKRKIHLQGSVGTPGSSSERKRKWKSSSSKSSATTISSDVLKKIIPDSVSKELTGDTVEDVFPDSSTTSHDSVTKPDEDVKTTITVTTGTEDTSGEKERLRLAEEETRRRIEIRLKERQDGEQKQQQQPQPLKPSDVAESDLTPNKEGNVRQLKRHHVMDTIKCDTLVVRQSGVYGRLERLHVLVCHQLTPLKSLIIVDYNQPIRVRSPSTNSNPPSCILHFTNLVRPFALSQLKELLSEDGQLVPDGFWINKIKSHCFAVYETVDAAMATRSRLDGVRWPVTNPKVITVDYSNEDEVLAETGAAMTITTSTAAIDHSDVVTAKSDTVQEKQVAKVEEKPKQAAVVKEEAAQVEEPVTTAQESGAGVQEADNKSAVNRLDELFKKTSAAPQIYWLPLTTEEGEKRLAAIKADEELRKQRREQRQKDREEKEKLEQEEREKRRKAREEERERRRKKQRSTSRHRSRSRSRHRSRSRSKHRSRSRSRHQR